MLFMQEFIILSKFTGGGYTLTNPSRSNFIHFHAVFKQEIYRTALWG